MDKTSYKCSSLVPVFDVKKENCLNCVSLGNLSRWDHLWISSISFINCFNITGEFLYFWRKASWLKKVHITFPYSIKDFAYYKVSEWVVIIKWWLHLLSAFACNATSFAIAIFFLLLPGTAFGRTNKNHFHIFRPG